MTHEDMILGLATSSKGWRVTANPHSRYSPFVIEHACGARVGRFTTYRGAERVVAFSPESVEISLSRRGARKLRRFADSLRRHETDKQQRRRVLKVWPKK